MIKKKYLAILFFLVIILSYLFISRNYRAYFIDPGPSYFVKKMQEDAGFKVKKSETYFEDQLKKHRSRTTLSLTGVFIGYRKHWRLCEKEPKAFYLEHLAGIKTYPRNCYYDEWFKGLSRRKDGNNIPIKVLYKGNRIFSYSVGEDGKLGTWDDIVYSSPRLEYYNPHKHFGQPEFKLEKEPSMFNLKTRALFGPLAFWLYFM